MPSRSSLLLPVLLCALSSTAAPPVAAAEPDLIVHGGRVVTVDRSFGVAQAMSVKDGKIVAVGSDADVLATKGVRTVVLHVGGKTVLPGLIDSHVHPSAAALTEFDHELPEMRGVADVLAYVRARAKLLGAGKWIHLQQVFITRLAERRYPTRAELDAAAPDNPVFFRTGPDASLNSLALRLSGIDRDFKVTDGGEGYAEKDPKTGEPTGILRGCWRYVKVESPARQPTERDRYDRTRELFRDYNAAGLTTVGDRAAEPDAIERYAKMRDAGELSLRLALSAKLDVLGTMDSIRGRIKAVAESPLRRDGDPMLRVIGVKVWLDGGMLTGSSYMLEPWGVSETFAVTDPKYRGVLLIPPQRLLPIARAAAEAGLQFKAHAVGDGAVRTLLDTYEQIGREMPPGALKATRPVVTHCNFVDPADVPRFAELGVAADVQPIWLHMDARALLAHFGRERLTRRFQPWRDMLAAGAMIGGGSDHMQKIGARRSINPYDPFLGIATAVTRRARGVDDGAVDESQTVTREQAIRMYTTNNAWLLFKENEVGSLEPGKLADFIVIDTDVLNCPAEEIERTKVLRTYLGGRLVYERK